MVSYSTVGSFIFNELLLYVKLIFFESIYMNYLAKTLDNWAVKLSKSFYCLQPFFSVCELLDTCYQQIPVDGVCSTYIKTKNLFYLLKLTGLLHKLNMSMFFRTKYLREEDRLRFWSFTALKWFTVRNCQSFTAWEDKGKGL